MSHRMSGRITLDMRSRHGLIGVGKLKVLLVGS